MKLKKLPNGNFLFNVKTCLISIIKKLTLILTKLMNYNKMSLDLTRKERRWENHL